MSRTKRKARLPEGWMGKRSRAWLATQAAAAQTVIEVGVWLGRSTLAMAAATRGTIWAVDHWRGTPDDAPQHDRLYAGVLAVRDPYAEFQKNLRGHLRCGRVVAVRMDSVAAAAHLRAERGVGWADFVFLDGDHSYAGIAADLEAYAPLVAPGGILAGHDWHWPGVERAVTEVCGPVERGPGSIWWTRV